MSRPLRITYPGAIYHIINRGSRRDKIFRRIGDRIEFLERLQASLEKSNGVLFGYCLMDNHFHLLIQTLEPNISNIMQTLQGGYANWFRFKHRLVGPLFQSRFKSVLVEIPELKFLTKKSPDRIKEIVLKHFNIKEKELLRSSRNNIPRKLFLHLLKKYSRLKLSEIAAFSEILPNSCGSLIIKFRNDIKKSKELKNLVDGIEEQLRNETS